MKTVSRCRWSESDDLLRAYHDEEWGVPERDSRALWEKLMLDGFQSGLSWLVILRKRDAFRRAFKGFDPKRVAKMTEKEIDRLMGDAGIVRSRPKIAATVGNAKAYLAMEKSGEDFSKFCWTMASATRALETDERPTKSETSEAMSKAFKERGFKFVGPVVVYAWMQAVGMVNDHEKSCFRRSKGLKPR